MSMRDEFEAAYRAAYPGQKVDRDNYGEYINTGAKIAWNVWQVGRARDGQEVELVTKSQVMGRVAHLDDGSVICYLNSIGRSLPDNTALYADTQPQPAQQGSVPEGWVIRREEDGQIYFSAPSGAKGAFARRPPKDDEPTSATTLDRAFFDLCSDLLSTTAQQGSVPDEYRQALQDAYDIIVSDANTPENYGSLCRIGHVLSQIATTPPQEQ